MSAASSRAGIPTQTFPGMSGLPSFLSSKRARIALIAAATVVAGVAAGFFVKTKTTGAGAVADLPETIDFSRDIRPIFNNSCAKCHGGVKEAGGVSFQFRESIFKKGESGRTPVVEKHPELSELIARIDAKDPSKLMPPGGPRIGERERALLRKWVEQGAPWGDHWAYVAPKLPALPEVKDVAGVRSPIDRFILARLETENLAPNPEAGRPALLRRLAIDLIGIPPTLAEVDAFVADTAPDAYEKQVDRLLASPHFGERWASVWMDLARYSDSRGFEKDTNRPMWPYRDWLVQAFNSDMPYDEFTVEQIAGDLLPEAKNKLSPLVATAFHRLTPVNDEGGTDDEEYRTYAVMDRTSTTWTAWMGTTFACVQCHGHTYDPIRHDEYYKFLAFFNNSADADRGDDSPTMPFAGAEAARMAAEFSRQSDALGAKDAGAVSVPVMRDLPPAKSRKSHVFVRGNWLVQGAEVTPDVPALFPPLPKDAPRNRLTLARWMTDTKNPLTARVAVNRLWEQLFGIGIVRTLEDFGTQGEAPSHPELLDWLALRFQNTNAWSVKKTLRDIVLSAAYRRSTVATPEMTRRDPSNRLLARRSRTRLTYEAVRDQALAVSGLLSPKMGGPSVMPPQPQGVWNLPYSGDRWIESKGEDKHRRAIYTFWKRSVPYPSFLTFDGTMRDVCVARRINTNSPLQSLVTMNDPVYVESAVALATRMEAEGGATPGSRIAFGYRAATLEKISDADAATLAKLYDTLLARYKAAPAEATKLAGTPEKAALAGVALALLNLDAVLNKS